MNPANAKTASSNRPIQAATAFEQISVQVLTVPFYPKIGKLYILYFLSSFLSQLKPSPTFEHNKN